MMQGCDFIGGEGLNADSMALNRLGQDEYSRSHTRIDREGSEGRV